MDGIVFLRGMRMLILLLLLGACAQVDRTMTLLEDRGAAASDRGLETAEWYICSASPIGAVLRRYFQSPVTAAAWAEICRPTVAVPVLPGSGV